MVNPGLDQEVALRSEIGRLALEFARTFSPETVGRSTREALAGLRVARVASFIPVLVHRFALAQVGGQDGEGRSRSVVCVRAQRR